MATGELLRYKQAAITHNMCAKAHREWDNATSKRDLVNLILEGGNVEFFCRSLTEDWGIDRSFLKEFLGDYINGGYTRECGYTAQLYVGFPFHMNSIFSTLLVLIDCTGDVVLGDYAFCEIHIVGEPDDLNIICPPTAKYSVYYY